MDDFQKRFAYFKQKRFVKYGIPFFGLLFGSLFCVHQFSKIKFTYGRPSSLLRPQDIKVPGLIVAPPGTVTLESEYEKLKELDIDNWVQVRVPRPWNEEDEEE